MVEDHALSAAQLTAMLDHAPVAVLVTLAQTHRVCYANRLAKEMLLPQGLRDDTRCYQIAGFEAPCAFCHAETLRADALSVREFHRAADNRTYQLSGKRIDWNDQPAYIEYILDITDKRNTAEADQKRRQELQRTFNSIPCGLSVYRLADGIISPLFHNPDFYEIMGYSEEHIRRVEQQTDYLGVHPDDIALLRHKIGLALQSDGAVQHAYRVWNDKKATYQWIHLDGVVKPQRDGTKLLYGIYRDISEEKQLRQSLTDASESMKNIVNAIPGGVALYKISDIIQTLYFSDGVPELSGYTTEEYNELAKGDAADLVHPDDLALVTAQLQKAIQSHEPMDFEFRKQHRNGQAVWVHMQGRQVGEDDGCPVFQCIFHNITELKKAQFRLDNLINSIPGGIAIYQVERGRFIPTFSSDGVMAISGHSREEYRQMIAEDAFNMIYEPDKQRVHDAAQAALESGEILDVSYRMFHKNGLLIWVHLNGRRVGPLAEVSEFYVVFTGMSEESRLYQNIADETADSVYVIDRQSYELLYANEARNLFAADKRCIGQKCYHALHGKDAPCSFCTLQSHKADGKEHDMVIASTDKFYATRFRETNWNGVPAYVKYVRDITEEVKTREEKERLELYFQTIVANLAGGVAVVHHKRDGSIKPEFLSDGFAALTGMTVEEAWELYQQNALTGVHPDDQAFVAERMNAYIASGDRHCEIVYRLQKKNCGYIWVKTSFTIMKSEDDESFVYAFYHDITKEREKQEALRQQYNDIILQHYTHQSADTLVVGHCNVTQNRILEIHDHTNSGLLQAFGNVREEFFQGLSSLVVDEAERGEFLRRFLNAPSLAAFAKHETERTLVCFIKLPKEKSGQYAKFTINLVETPDTRDITGILTVTDVTTQVISDRILHQLSVTSYDYVIDLDIEQDSYTLLAYNKNASYVPQTHGRMSERVSTMTNSALLPKDRALYQTVLEPSNIRRRLEAEGSFTVSYSLTDADGEIRTKNMTVSAVDLRLHRVCLVCTDITESVRVLEDALTLAENANRAKSDFLSAMSHDIRTPMNAIMGMTDIATVHLDDRERVADCLQKISVSGKHLLSLINDILDMSRIERSEMVMNRMDTSLPDLMHQVRTIIEPQAKAAGLRFTMPPLNLRHSYFYGDALRVNQILINLLSNAVKFTPEGEVWFLVEEISPLRSKTNVRYRFTIRDTGVGIPEDFLDHLFDPFARSNNAVRIEGTGLGLSITKGLVAQMEGEISVKSRPGQGTAFIVELEFEPAKNEEAARTAQTWANSIAFSKENAFSGRRFLVAEDNALNSEILCELLRIQGAASEVKTNGQQTLEAFQAAAPDTYDAILMDIQMPVLDGHQATRAIRALERPDAKKIPIIAMTANAFAEDVQKAKDAGMTAHVAKPIDIDLLRVALNNALDGDKTP